jgi:glycosyltransferase involved in cell wall biosynthesis
MLRILAVIPDLSYSGAGKQLVLLASNLAKERFDLRVCVIGRAGPLLAPLRNAGITVELLNWHRAIDVRPLLEFRKLLAQFEPHVIHTWRKQAWQFARLADPRSSRPFVINAAEINPQPKRLVGTLDYWLLPRDMHVVASSKSQATKYLTQGIAPCQVTHVLPAAETDGLQQPVSNPQLEALGLSSTARIVACIGPLEATKGFFDAIWAFDILKYLYDDLHLVIAGDGPDRERLKHLIRSDTNRSDVHLVGRLTETSWLLARAEVVLIPSLIERGLNVALEAMAARRPVVASRLPAIAEFVVDGETGLFFPPGNKVAMARQTRILLDDERQRKRLGEAGRERVRLHFGIQNAVAQYSGIYELAINKTTSAKGRGQLE